MMELNLFVKCARSACTPNLNRKDSRYRRELVSASSPSSSQMNANRQQSMKQPDATAVTTASFINTKIIMKFQNIFLKYNPASFDDLKNLLTTNQLRTLVEKSAQG
ncbi:hypothetical protein T10_3731 [Trichinella papuae]|uniref:Uncharacterized protein n=1 Tax=Trichinella papuae TaxID=268474 RepID=A0A0V1MJZ8_9BILA|nr:hypothetical protein T10_3731 [Trichinella papuae]